MSRPPYKNSDPGETDAPENYDDFNTNFGRGFDSREYWFDFQSNAIQGSSDFERDEDVDEDVDEDNESESNRTENPTDNLFSIVFKKTQYGYYVKVINQADVNGIFLGGLEECQRLVKPLNSLCRLLGEFGKNDTEFLYSALKEFSLTLSKISACVINNQKDVDEVSITEFYKTFLIKKTLYIKVLEFVNEQIVEDLKRGNKVDLFELTSYEMSKFDSSELRKDHPQLFSKYVKKQVFPKLERDLKTVAINQQDLMKVFNEICSHLRIPF